MIKKQYLGMATITLASTLVLAACGSSKTAESGNQGVLKKSYLQRLEQQLPFLMKKVVN